MAELEGFSPEPQRATAVQCGQRGLQLKQMVCVYLGQSHAMELLMALEQQRQWAGTVTGTAVTVNAFTCVSAPDELDLGLFLAPMNFTSQN